MASAYTLLIVALHAGCVLATGVMPLSSTFTCPTLHLVNESWWQYVARVTGNAPGKTVAAAASVDQATVSRWKSGQARPSAETAVKFARSWGRSPVEALIACGLLSRDDVASAVQVQLPLDAYDDGDIVEEIKRRLLRGSE